MEKNYSCRRRAIVFALCLFFAQCLVAQSKLDVTLVVTDAIGEPIIGASVVEKGTTNGAITNIDGVCSILVEPGATLVVSYMGYVSHELRPRTSGTLNVALAEDLQQIDELVVVGYGVQKKVNLTGAVSSISSREIEDIPTANATSLLQGRLPGVVLTSSGGQAGADTPEIRIRGIGTLSDNNDPMVLIDDVQTIIAEGNMTATLTDLPYGTQYTYRAYVVTAIDTYYRDNLQLCLDKRICGNWFGRSSPRWRTPQQVSTALALTPRTWKASIPPLDRSSTRP